MNSNQEIEIRILHLMFAEERGSANTYCPSEIAKRIDSSDWRNKMDLVRQVADGLVKSGQLLTLRKGDIINDLPTKAKGPIRLKGLFR